MNIGKGRKITKLILSITDQHWYLGLGGNRKIKIQFQKARWWSMAPQKALPPCHKPLKKHFTVWETNGHTIRNGQVLKERLLSTQHFIKDRFGLYARFLGLFMFKTTIVCCTQEIMKLKEVLFIYFCFLKITTNFTVQLFLVSKNGIFCLSIDDFTKKTLLNVFARLTKLSNFDGPQFWLPLLHLGAD